MIARLRTEHIMAEIRRERVRLVKQAPDPVVINIDAVLTVGQSREFQWGAIKLHAPPLSFNLGARLLVASEAIKELQKKNAPPQAIKAAQSLAVALLRQAVKPSRRIDTLRCWYCVLAEDSPEETVSLIDWLLYVPDDAEYPPITKKIMVDFMDAVAAFVKAFPAWTKDGWPISWAHYTYGHRHMGRAAARDELRQAIASRAGQADMKGWREYARDQQEAAGW
jgi:hypothetical protein